MSLLGYFWLFNILNVLDGVFTLLGIKLGVFQEANPATIFYIETFGLYQTMLATKLLGLALSLLAYYWKFKAGLVLVIIIYGLMVGYQIISLVEYAYITAAMR